MVLIHVRLGVIQGADLATLLFVGAAVTICVCQLGEVSPFQMGREMHCNNSMTIFNSLPAGNLCAPTYLQLILAGLLS